MKLRAQDVETLREELTAFPTTRVVPEDELEAPTDTSEEIVFEDDAAPLLPKGTILHVIGFLDTTEGTPNVADSRNWAGGGRRSVANMFIDLGYSVELTEEQFQSEMADRRAKMKSRNDYDIGCPLCLAPVPTEMSTTTDEGGQQ